jgi:hypothetical protein
MLWRAEERRGDAGQVNGMAAGSHEPWEEDRWEWVAAP